jgi:Protein of unknown function (DUF2946)
MDEIVKAALKKWPNVPHCFGWLALDARGDWYMRDERIQLRDPFPRVKGSRIEHDKLIAFIERNYGADEAGAWFFQNGPQRVYVQLEAAPWIWRLRFDGDAMHVTSHTGVDTRADGCWIDERERLYLSTPIGLGLVHSLDVAVAAEAVERNWWQPLPVRFDELPRRFGYQLTPAPA